jgi:hypothetical protein
MLDEIDETRCAPGLAAFVALWRSKCGERALPARRDFAFEDFRPWFGTVTLLEAVDGGADFRITLHGTANAERFRIDATGLRVSELPAPWRDAVLPGIAAVRARRAPFLTRHRWINERFDYEWERLLAPFATDGETIDGLVSVISDVAYKSFLRQ